MLELAVRAIDAMPGTSLRAVSRVYWSAPVGGVARQAFHNAAVRLETTKGPDDFVRALLALERRLGRRPSRVWADRRIDLDLLAWGGRIVVGHTLALPHPRLTERAFALGPLLEVWPDGADPWTARPYSTFPHPPLPVTGVLPRPRRPR